MKKFLKEKLKVLENVTEKETPKGNKFHSIQLSENHIIFIFPVTGKYMDMDLSRLPENEYIELKLNDSDNFKLHNNEVSDDDFADMLLDLLDEILEEE